jgi:hypothetical protein
MSSSSDRAPVMVNHDVAPGPLDRCQITGSTDLHLVIDLGHQPPCHSLLSAEMVRGPELTYPLRLFHCPQSGLAQLDYVVDQSLVYYPDYPYRAGVSQPLVEYQGTLATDVTRRCEFSAGAMCVDVGCNDATLLSHFKRLGFRTLGIEPTNIARLARAEQGIEILQSFFTSSLARDIVVEHGQADLITMTNVFAHMAGLGEVMRGLCELLSRSGVFVTESHYLLDILEKDQFDTIYHEHIRSYSVKALVTLFPYYGLEVFHVERGTRYGGNIRAYVAWEGQRPIDQSVGSMLALEEETALHDPHTWALFRSRVAENRDTFMEFLYRTHREGKRVAGYSCPGRSSPLLNYFGINSDLVPYIAELPNSLKLGLFSPGVHIPIVSTDKLREDQPDYVIAFAWHYAEAIAERLRREGVRSKMITPLPRFTVHEQVEA